MAAANDFQAKGIASSAQAARERAEEGRRQLQLLRPTPQRDTQTVFAEFSGFTHKLSYNSRGDMIWTVVVPHEHRDNAQCLPDTFGMPLVFNVQSWSPLGPHKLSSERNDDDSDD